MKTAAVLPALALLLVMGACRNKPDEVEVSETRALTSFDEEPLVNASADEQFLPPEFLAQIKEMKGGFNGEGAAKSNWKYHLPADDWKILESKQFREVNLTFGEGEAMGEVYLSVAGGGLLPNAVRWYRQFGNSPQTLAEMGRLEFLGREGYLVETSGRYNPGMGRPARDKQALLGALVEDENERLVTVKMIGPEAEVATRREQFFKFVASLIEN